MSKAHSLNSFDLSALASLFPFLTIGNVRAVLPEAKEVLHSFFANCYFDSNYQAANGVIIETIYDTGLVCSDIDFIVLNQRLQVLAPVPAGGGQAPLLQRRPFPATEIILGGGNNPGLLHFDERDRAAATLRIFRRTVADLTAFLLTKMDTTLQHNTQVNGSHMGLTCTNFLTTLDALYGTFTREDRDLCLKIFKTPFDSSPSASFEEDVAKMRRQINVIARHTAPLTEPEKVDQLLANMRNGMHPERYEAAHQQVVRYLQDNNTLATATFDGLAAYVQSRTIWTLVRNVASLGLIHQTSSDLIQAKVYTQEELDNAVKLGSAAAASKHEAAPKHFCFFHGSGNHAGTNCKLLQKTDATVPGDIKAASKPGKLHGFKSSATGLFNDQRAEFKTRFGLA